MSTLNNGYIVSDVMLSLGNFPVITEKVILKEALEQMSNYKIGIVCIVDNNSKLLGILTDGDIRRMLLTIQKPFSAFFSDDALDHANLDPLKIQMEDFLINAVSLMEKRSVWDLPVVDSSGFLVGLFHLHPAIKILVQPSNESNQ